MLEKWTRGAVRNRFAIIATWIVLGVFGFLGASQLDGLLTTSLTVPGSQSAQADEILTNSYHENVEGSFTVLYKFRNATDTEIQSFKHSIDVAASSIATAKVTQSRALGGYLYANIGTSFNLSEAAKFTPQLRIALAHQGLNEAMVTGPPAIKYDVTPVLSSDLKRGEIIAVLLALVLLILMLGFSWAVVVPFIFAGATISLTLGIVYLLAHRFLMVLYVPNIIELIGLGLAIDYSLIIVHRFRRERMQDSVQSVEDAIVRTMQTSGRTVVLSGASVAIGLTVLLFIPVPFIRSLGTAGVVVPLVSIFCALTLQPALLSFLG
ncbi:MAG: MMPL family transporter, partial [Actinobacteria bacterium]|nr:MMPL family transporter [Actinomycetota bacterium]